MQKCIPAILTLENYKIIGTLNLIAILQKYNLTRLGNQSRLCMSTHTINFADNRQIPFVDNRIHKKRLGAFQGKFTPLPHPPNHVAITFIFYRLFYTLLFMYVSEFCIYFFFFLYFIPMS